MKKLKVYPVWVCRDCGLEASGGKCFSLSTYHVNKCDVCEQEKAVTEPRDFYYPSLERFNEIRTKIK